MRISTQQKLDNYRNMVGMIIDYRKQYNRLPTNKEFEVKLEISPSSVKRYKSAILQEEKSILLKKFQDDMLFRVSEVITSIDKNVGIFEKIRDKTSSDDTAVMSAGKLVIESKLDAIRVMRDGPDFLKINYDDVSNKQEHIHKQDIREERIRESIESIFD